jgi:inorganic pyrophosphatase
LIKEPTFVGCVLTVRPIALFRMFDQTDPDDKVLSVVANDPLYDDYHDLEDVPRHYLREVAHFFERYKDLEGKRVHPIGWQPRSAALERIAHAQQPYQEHYAKRP